LGKPREKCPKGRDLSMVLLKFWFKNLWGNLYGT
jgi:hypothetical protein